MAINFFQQGDIISVTVSEPVQSGQVLVLEHTLGVAASSAVAGEAIAVHIEGVFRLPKVSAAEFPIGSNLNWDVSAGAFDAPTATPGTGDILGGAIAIEAGINGATTILAKLTPSADHEIAA